MSFESRDPIAELAGKVQAEFRLLSKVALAFINRRLEDAALAQEKRFKDEELCVKFYPIEEIEVEAEDQPESEDKDAPKVMVKRNDLPSVFMMPAKVFPENPRGIHYASQSIDYLEKLYNAVIKEIEGIRFAKKYDLNAAHPLVNQQSGFGVNLPLSERTVMQLRELTKRMLNFYPLDNIENQLKGDVSLQLPTDILLEVLILRQAQAESEAPNPTRTKFPEEFNLTRVTELLGAARLKLREEEKAIPRVQEQ